MVFSSTAGDGILSLLAHAAMNGRARIVNNFKAFIMLLFLSRYYQVADAETQAGAGLASRINVHWAVLAVANANAVNDLEYMPSP